MKNAWCIASDCEALVAAHDGRLCDHSHEHVIGRGKLLKLSGDYDPELASILHKAFEKY